MDEEFVGTAAPEHVQDPLLAELRACVSHVFCEGEEAYLEFDRYWPEPEVVIPGALYRLHMRVREGDLSPSRTLTVFRNLEELGRRFWTQEVRILQRLNGMEHDALPEIHDGGVAQPNPAKCPGVREFAYVLTDGVHEYLNDPEVRAEMRSSPRLFVSRLLRLADALAALHRDGLLHRNIQPASIACAGLGTPEFCLSLRRFEMSSLQADLLRRGIEFDAETEDEVAWQALSAFIGQGREALACVPRERLEYVFGADDLDDIPEQAAGDVFSLGMVVFQCLVCELDQDHLQGVFPTAPAGDPRRYEFNRAGWSAFHGWLTKQIRSAPIGPTLQGLLMWMLEPEPIARLRSVDLEAELSDAWPRIAGELSPARAESGPPWLVAINPTEMGILQSWGWISEPSLTSPDGRAELRQFLEDDLSEAILEHAPGELLRNHPNPHEPEKMRKAQWVLRGALGYHYGHLYENYRARTGEPAVFKNVFILRYTLRRDVLDRNTGEYTKERFGLRVAPLRFADQNDDEVKYAYRGEAPSWEQLLELVTVPAGQSAGEIDAFAGALRWLLAYQHVELEARRYPFTRVDDPRAGPSVGRTARLRYDEARDREWRAREALRNLYTLTEERRPSFADFFGAPEDHAFDGTVRWWPDTNGAPDRTPGSGGRAELEDEDELLEPNTIVVRLGDGDDNDIPAKGWIEPADDQGQESALWFQRHGVQHDLPTRKRLLAKLIHPVSYLRPEVRWEKAAEGLEGERTGPVLQRMLAADPIYVLQGPPGTGKTTLVARAVRQALEDDPAIRILVSAQSHFALDHLAMTLDAVLPRGTLAVRVASGSTEARVDSSVRKWTRTELMGDRPQEVLREVGAYLEVAPPELQPVLQQWADKVLEWAPEILDRTYRGANLVFSTCLQAGDTGPVLAGRPPLFDWVIIEEAAKALPTELAIPLVRGARWTLIGDHKQLPAYKTRERRTFLGECVTAAREDPSLTGYLQGAEQFPRFFNIFAAFFDETETGSAVRPASRRRGGMERPVDALNVQFRMVPPIGDMVSDAFYGGKLKNADRQRDPFLLDVPEAFGDARLIWLDTGSEPYITGNGECSPGEADVVARLVKGVWRGVTPEATDLAILTPYRRQLRELLDSLPASAGSPVYTVDSFQGREANVVIVSLVRGYLRVPPRGIHQRIGHLAEAARVNVLMSRAREYLIVVGQFRHFLDAGRSVNSKEEGAFWATLCEHFAQNGKVIPTPVLFGEYPGDRR